MVGVFNDFASRMANIVHRFGAEPEDVDAVMGLIRTGRIHPTVTALSPMMPASCSYDPMQMDECTS